MATLRNDWCDYDSAVLPESLPPFVRAIARRSFYAGAHAALVATRAIVMGNTDGPSIEAGFNQLLAETMEFKDKVTRGEA